RPRHSSLAGPGPPPAQRPGQRPAGGEPQSRLDESAADVELTALQQQPSRQPGRRPAPARRPQGTQQPGTAPGDADATSPGKAGANDAAAAMKQYAPAIGELADQYFNAAEKFLTDANAASFSLNLTDAGLNTTMMAEFSQGSYFGKIASGFKNSKGNLMAGLPGERKYFAFGG